MNYNEIFKNKDNIYFAHGSGTNKEEIINSIIENGLRCNHGALQFTSIYLGTKDNVLEYGKDMLENWSYKNSGIVFILSLPKYFCIADRDELNTTKKQYLAFCFMPTQEEIDQKKLVNKLHIYKEFIVGYYDSMTNEFVKNEKYYELLTKEEQTNFLTYIKEQYIKIIEGSCDIESYKELIKKYNIDNGFDENIVETIINNINKKEIKEKSIHINVEPEIPDILKEYIGIKNGKTYQKSELPKELEKDYEIFLQINNIEETNNK